MNEFRKVSLTWFLMDEFIMELERRAFQKESDSMNNLDKGPG